MVVDNGGVATINSYCLHHVTKNLHDCRVRGFDCVGEQLRCSRIVEGSSKHGELAADGIERRQSLLQPLSVVEVTADKQFSSITHCHICAAASPSFLSSELACGGGILSVGTACEDSIVVAPSVVGSNDGLRQEQLVIDCCSNTCETLPCRCNSGACLAGACTARVAIEQHTKRRRLSKQQQQQKHSAETAGWTPTTAAGSPVSCIASNEDADDDGDEGEVLLHSPPLLSICNASAGLVPSPTTTTASATAVSPVAMLSHIDPTTRPTEFLWTVKAAAAVVRRKSAIQRAEERFERGEMLSVASDDDSQGSVFTTGRHSDLSSANSNRACIDFRLRPQASREAMRQYLVAQGRSVQQVDFEMRSRPSVEKVRASQRRRKRLYNAWLMRRKRQLLLHQRQQPQGQPQQLSLLVSAQTLPDYRLPPQRPPPRSWTRDQRIAESRRQKQITELFATLQGMRNAGQISTAEFEAGTQRIFLALFERGSDGVLRPRRTNWHALEAARKAVAAVRARAAAVTAAGGEPCACPSSGAEFLLERCPWSLSQMPAWRPGSGWEETLDDTSAPAGGSNRHTPPLVRHDLRLLLMRRIDQRAPPFARLFCCGGAVTPPRRRMT